MHERLSTIEEKLSVTSHSKNKNPHENSDTLSEKASSEKFSKTKQSKTNGTYSKTSGKSKTREITKSCKLKSNKQNGTTVEKKFVPLTANVLEEEMVEENENEKKSENFNDNFQGTDESKEEDEENDEYEDEDKDDDEDDDEYESDTIINEENQTELYDSESENEQNIGKVINVNNIETELTFTKNSLRKSSKSANKKNEPLPKSSQIINNLEDSQSKCNDTKSVTSKDKNINKSKKKNINQIISKSDKTFLNLQTISSKTKNSSTVSITTEKSKNFERETYKNSTNDTLKEKLMTSFVEIISEISSKINKDGLIKNEDKNIEEKSKNLEIEDKNLPLKSFDYSNMDEKMLRSELKSEKAFPEPKQEKRSKSSSQLGNNDKYLKEDIDSESCENESQKSFLPNTLDDKVVDAINECVSKCLKRKLRKVQSPSKFVCNNPTESCRPTFSHSCRSIIPNIALCELKTIQNLQQNVVPTIPIQNVVELQKTQCKQLLEGNLVDKACSAISIQSENENKEKVDRGAYAEDLSQSIGIRLRKSKDSQSTDTSKIDIKEEDSYQTSYASSLELRSRSEGKALPIEIGTQTNLKSNPCVKISSHQIMNCYDDYINWSTEDECDESIDRYYNDNHTVSQILQSAAFIPVQECVQVGIPKTDEVNNCLNIGSMKKDSIPATHVKISPAKTVCKDYKNNSCLNCQKQIEFGFCSFPHSHCIHQPRHSCQHHQQMLLNNDHIKMVTDQSIPKNDLQNLGYIMSNRQDLSNSGKKQDVNHTKIEFHSNISYDVQNRYQIKQDAKFPGKYSKELPENPFCYNK